MQEFTFTLVDPYGKIFRICYPKTKVLFPYLIGSDGKNAVQIFNEFSKCGPLVRLVTPAIAHQHITATHGGVWGSFRFHYSKLQQIWQTFRNMKV